MPKKALGYGEKTWKGRTVYQCAECPYDTADETQIEQHVVAAHPKPAPVPKPPAEPVRTEGSDA